jgi:glycerol-3-phosphate dehydrogenase (NAD(P)+)
MRVAVIGAGSWGTALAMQLARADNSSVAMWDHNAARAAEMQERRENSRYLAGLPFPELLRVSGDLGEVLDGAEVVLEVIPSQSVREVMAEAAHLMADDVVICCASKGIEQGSLLTMDEVLQQVLPERLHGGLCFLAGPSFAKEVAAGLPTAVVVAGHSVPAADKVAAALHGGMFRAYHTDDVVGAELGGALKNVIAIACGVSDGCGAGLNARAALITRGLAEITRVAVARGANPLTLAGLAGLGDLVLTCTGDLSRNRRVGLGLGQGRLLPDILTELGQVAEGVTTTAVAVQLAEKTGVEMPIAAQIHALLFEEKPVADALRALLGRERKHERG